MPTARFDEVTTQKLTSRAKGLPRKRKQEPEDDFTTQSTPSKGTKRVKHEALSPIRGLRKAQTRSRYTGQNDASNHLISEAESEADEEEVSTTIRDKSRTKSRTKINAHSESDQVKTPVSVKQTRWANAKTQVAESTSTEAKHQSTTPSDRKTKSSKKVAVTVGLEEAEQFEGDALNKTPRKRGTAQENAETISAELKEETDTPLKKKTTSKSKATETADLGEDDQVTPKKTPRKRKTKEEKEAEAMPLAARTSGLRMFIGAHVSIATGVEKAVTNCLHIG